MYVLKAVVRNATRVYVSSCFQCRPTYMEIVGFQISPNAEMDTYFSKAKVLQASSEYLVKGNPYQDRHRYTPETRKHTSHYFRAVCRQSDFVVHTSTLNVICLTTH